jgi:hypothetical protein
MTNPFGFDPNRFKSPPIRRIAAYWLSKCTSGRLPRRADILPEEIGRDLPFVYLVDVLEAPLAFRFRLVGTQVTVWSERDYTGATVNAAEYGPNWQPIYKVYQELVTTKAPSASELHAPWRKREFHYYERFLGPLSDDNSRINMIFGALHTVQSPRSATTR